MQCPWLQATDANIATTQIRNLSIPALASTTRLDRTRLKRSLLPLFSKNAHRLQRRWASKLCVCAAIRLSTWWSLSGSNRRPPACKAGALPAELRPRVVGLGGLEPPASPLSGVRSNHLSYRPGLSCADCAGYLCGRLDRQFAVFGSQKEVIQPHLPIRLPCYDFTPVIGHTVASALLAVRLPASGATNSHGVTGGVYKARERIHRSNADLRLLAIPTSRSRVADSDPD